MSTETEIRELIGQINSQVSESKKRLSDLRSKVLDEETTLIGLSLKLEKQKELLRRQSGAVIINEFEEKNNLIDSDFRSRLDSLLISVK